MRVSVDGIVVIRRGGKHLESSLQALSTQSHSVARLCVIDISADSAVPAHIEAALSSSDLIPEVITLPYGTPWAEAIDEGFQALFGDGEIPEGAWVWLLRDDTEPHPDALSHMVLSVEGAPTVRIAGPKQRITSRPLVIREMGETMSGFGERMALAERELDQAQYDRLSDVLAVGEAGMFVHASTVQSLGGFDHVLTPLDGGLDLGVRARLAGHRVVVIPRAIVSVGQGPADWHFGKSISGLRQHYLSRRAWLYRRFVYAPAWALIPILLWALPWALARGVGQVLLKHPDRIVAEVAAALSALTQLAGVFEARALLARTQVVSWAAVESLRLSAPEVQKRRAISRETRLAEAEEKAQVQARPAIFPALPWLLLALTALAGLIHGRWWGAEGLLGGGLLPVSGTVQDLWAGVWSTTPYSVSLDAASVPADPIQFLLAAMGSLTWWQPSLAVVLLFVAAIPLAGLVAWWGASQVLSKAWTTAVVAGIWAVAPTFLLALGDGRIGAVIAHIALPWLVGSALSAHESWQRVGQLSLATLIVLAAAPILWPAVVVGLVVLACVRVWSHPFRMFVGVLPLALLPSVLLALPRFGAWWQSVSGRWWDEWGVLLADPGVAVPFAAGSWWEMASGWPTGTEGWAALSDVLGVSSSMLSILLVVVGAPLVVLAVLSLALGKTMSGATFALLFALGLLTAVTAPVLFAGYEGFDAASVWPGTGVSLLILGVVLGAGATLDRVDFEDALGNALGGAPPWLARTAGVVVIAFAALQIAPFVYATWSGNVPVQANSEARTLPAFVAAEAANNPQVGTLVIQATPEGFDVSLERGAGAVLNSTSTLVRARSTEVSKRDEDLARLVAALVRPSSADPAPLLQEYGIRFIWLKTSAESEAALTLAQRPELVAASSAAAGQLWQVPDVTAPVLSPVDSENGWGQGSFWFFGVIASLLAIPTERRSRSGSRRIDDALPSLGEETSDDL
jgi:GT2 family glycosyltransferase